MNSLIKNRIQKQLLNFDQDLEFDKSNTVQKNIDKTIEREKWILENMVDLGLPSGTLWMKNNLDATCGNTPESWYGNYYAWGELESKINYKEDTYTYKDNPITLPLNHDIVYQKTNGICYMPTRKWLEELINETKNEWIENYKDINGLNGRVITGTNGNILFIPAAGYYFDSAILRQGSYCCMWTSSSTANCAYNLYSYSNDIWEDHCYRFDGFSVRGVYKIKQ